MKRTTKFLPLIVAFLFAGCIVTGNVLIVIELEDAGLQTGEDFKVWEVSKEKSSDWKEHEDDINHVVDIGFSMIITNNNTANAATGEFYISKNGNLANASQVRANGIKILGGIEVAPGATKKITWPDSYNYLSNFDILKQYVMDGGFWVYATGIGTNLNIDIKNPAVILTINAKP